MCDCIKQTTESSQKYIVKQVEEKNTIDEWVSKGRYMNTGYSMSGGSTKIGMSFIAEYRRRKVNGEPEKKLTTVNMTIYPTYCPFCGEKYSEK